MINQNTFNGGFIPKLRMQFKKHAPVHTDTRNTLFKQMFLIVLLISLTVVLAGIGYYGISHSTQSKPIKLTSKSIVTPKKSSTNTCSNTAQTSDTVFAICPSLSLNYTNALDGSINTQYFNVFTGEPAVNEEAEYYTDNVQNLQISDGSLQLRAIKQSTDGYQYTSARIDTKGKEDFQYGKIVVRATLPDGIGAWPAIWMLPSNPKYASLSPDTDYTRYLNDGEIDIAEQVGAEAHDVYGIAHSLAYPADGSNRSYYDIVHVADNDTAYHDYELDWTPTNLTFKVDGKAFFSISKQKNADYRSWPYDQQFYLVLNLAVGGNWGGEDRSQFPIDGVDPKALPATMKVQSINYYPYVAK